jgi:hypothetical protein
MSSVLEIYNMALAHIGDRANVSSLTEQTEQAEVCRQFYPTALGMALAAFTWNFATRRASLVQLADITAPTPWSYAYAVPNDVQSVQAVLAASSVSSWDKQPYALEDLGSARVLYSMTESAQLRYTAKVSDTGFFPPHFTMALSCLLASMIAGPIVKGDSGIKLSLNLLQLYTTFLRQAQTLDANQGEREFQFMADPMNTILNRARA